MTDALWYLGRGSGVVSLVLLTVVVVLGIAGRSGRSIAGLPRFAVAAVHRAASLLSVVFLAIHVLTLLFDPYAQLDVLALVVPFTAEAQPFWYGLGAVAFDLVAALVVTSLLRHRIPPGIWKRLHLTAYLAWPVALAHGLGSGTDAGSAWMPVLTGLCVAAVAGAVAWRFSPRFAESGSVAERRAGALPPDLAGSGPTPQAAHVLRGRENPCDVGPGARRTTTAERAAR
ncbi:ferric reductase-like transmembrane domain-containing protein [Pseudonocardia endophytica]|uniref:Sulfoxide reductase heme-binding subunit YedZ n=1 Tax=Pseudonocardia endophytica TaxID=401976 RepID=A0A4R1HKP1_PSEEN|nr:ferric reductase-like transmembrane domain-containing protein [Pseudonocardia endophytica]TCK22957.1 sulfoxide reductase heme-binding subunit YedZ [Pseudonocardia endophytica]